jgi:hypothetical protein
LSKAEKDKIQQLCCTNNFALFAIKTQDDYTQAVVQINRQVGLLDYDQHLYAQSNGAIISTLNNTKFLFLKRLVLPYLYLIFWYYSAV